MDLDLVADCGSCSGLCCVAPAFARSADFALDKPAETPCPNLRVSVPGRSDAPCSIHATLSERGFPGCVAFDCFGAGQRVSADWRDGPAAAREAFDAFAVLRPLHEVLWYLTEPCDDAPAELRDEVARAASRVAALADGPLGEVDVAAVRAEVGELLGRVSEAVRSSGRGSSAPGHARADLVGRDLRGGRASGSSLTGTTLRGALLMGADLRGVDLGRADLLGADLRGADLRGASLDRTLFLTAPQVASARGDAATTVPGRVPRPSSWGPA
ncbi:pentapeptide repeat-containing protein [Actinomycetospora sp. TBRC 11914]|uniref:pentapeptide repeat-containing protein n=1 Tax=Actinomycetospora sp. TBRC 11914 TaxID=2729387 RepID=UPI00145F7724|nr:pentapeptide repeat-containing protein [Actinomycetospora sp. TBRC 11914]NMO91824.1 pentapeptide repeat-containing protein [Actinomycetospora sp. TBRC 11914]